MEAKFKYRKRICNKDYYSRMMQIYYILNSHEVEVDFSLKLVRECKKDADNILKELRYCIKRHLDLQDWIDRNLKGCINNLLKSKS